MYSNDQIQLIANELLKQFIPKDKTQTELSFNFTTPDNSYLARYAKNEKGEWQFLSAEVVSDAR